MFMHTCTLIYTFIYINAYICICTFIPCTHTQTHTHTHTLSLSLSHTHTHIPTELGIKPPKAPKEARAPPSGMKENS